METTTTTTSSSLLRHYTLLPTLHVVTSPSWVTTTTKLKLPSPLSATRITPHFHSTTFPFTSSSSTTATFQRKNHGVFSTAADAASAAAGDNDPIAILLEVEGVVMDVYRWGNRQAFNLAFQKLGLDCANWTEPIYLDLIRKAYGDEERMLMLFFNRIGWPTSLPTNEKEKFMKSVIREKRNALDEFVISKSLPLRPGLEDFIDDALVGGIPVIILTAYCHNEDKLARSIIEKLGEDRASRIKIVGKEEVEGSFYGQLVLHKGESVSLDEQLAEQVKKAADAEKQRIANEVASLLKVSVNLDSGTTESFDKNVATLRAGAEYAGATVQNCVLIAGSQSGLLGAERIGMPCVVLRSSLTSRTEFPSANAVMDGFGGADLTISKLRQKAWS